MNYLHVLIKKYVLFTIILFDAVPYHIKEAVMNNKKLLGRRIKEIRKKRGFTQEQLAEAVNIDITTLSGIESGRHFPSLVTLEKISDTLDSCLAALFDFSRLVPVDEMKLHIKDNINALPDEDVKFIYRLIYKKSQEELEKL